MYLAFLLFVCLFAPGSRLTGDVSGRWEAKIQLPERLVGVILELGRTERGVWTGSMSIPISSSIDVRVAKVIVDGATVTFAGTLPVESAWQGAAGAIMGAWIEKTARVPLTFRRPRSGPG